MEKGYCLSELTLFFKNGTSKVISQQDKFDKSYQEEFEKLDKPLETGCLSDPYQDFKKIVVELKMGIKTYKGEEIQKARYIYSEVNGINGYMSVGQFVKQCSEDFKKLKGPANSVGDCFKLKTITVTLEFDADEKKITLADIKKTGLEPHERIHNYKLSVYDKYKKKIYRENSRYNEEMKAFYERKYGTYNGYYDDSSFDYDEDEFDEDGEPEEDEDPSSYGRSKADIEKAHSERLEKILSTAPDELKSELLVLPSKEILDYEAPSHELEVSNYKGDYVTPKRKKFSYTSPKTLHELRELEADIAKRDDSSLYMLDLLGDDSKNIKRTELYKWVNLKPFNQARLSLLASSLELGIEPFLDVRANNKVNSYLSNLSEEVKIARSNGIKAEQSQELYNKGILLPGGLDTLANYAYGIYNYRQYGFKGNTRLIDNPYSYMEYHYTFGTKTYYAYNDAHDEFQACLKEPSFYNIKCFNDDVEPAPYFGNTKYRFFIRGYEKYNLSMMDLIKNYTVHIEMDCVNGKHMLFHVYLDESPEHSVKLLDFNKNMSSEVPYRLLDEANSQLKSLGLKEIDFTPFKLNPFEIRKNVILGSFDDYSDECNEPENIYDMDGHKNRCTLVGMNLGNRRGHTDKSYRVSDLVLVENKTLYTIETLHKLPKVTNVNFRSIGTSSKQEAVDPFIDGDGECNSNPSKPITNSVKSENSDEEKIDAIKEALETMSSLTNEDILSDDKEPLEDEIIESSPDEATDNVVEEISEEVNDTNEALEEETIEETVEDNTNDLVDEFIEDTKETTDDLSSDKILNSIDATEGLKYEPVEFEFATGEEIGKMPNPCERDTAFTDNYGLNHMNGSSEEIIFEFAEGEYFFLAKSEYESDYLEEGSLEKGEDLDKIWDKLVAEVEEGRHSYKGREIQKLIFRTAGSMNSEIHGGIVYHLEEEKKLYYNSSYDEFYEKAEDMMFISHDDVYDLKLHKRYFRYGSFDCMDMDYEDYEPYFSTYRLNYDKDMDVLENPDMYALLEDLSEYGKLIYNDSIINSFSDIDRYILDNPINERICRFDRSKNEPIFKMVDKAGTDNPQSFNLDRGIVSHTLKDISNSDKIKLFKEGKYLIDSLNSLYGYRIYLKDGKVPFDAHEDFYKIAYKDPYGKTLYGEPTYGLTLEFNTVRFVMGHTEGRGHAYSKLLPYDLMMLFTNYNALKLEYDEEGLYAGVYVLSDDVFAMRIDIEGYEKYGLSAIDVARDYTLQVVFDGICDNHYLYHIYLSKSEARGVSIIKQESPTSPLEIDNLIKDVNNYCILNLSDYFTGDKTLASTIEIDRASTKIEEEKLTDEDDEEYIDYSDEYDDDEDDNDYSDEYDDDEDDNDEDEIVAKVSSNQKATGSDSAQSTEAKKEKIPMSSPNYRPTSYFAERLYILRNSYYMRIMAFMTVLVIIGTILVLCTKIEFRVYIGSKGSTKDLYNIFDFSPFGVAVAIITIIFMISTQFFSTQNLHILSYGVTSIGLFINTIIFGSYLYKDHEIAFDMGNIHTDSYCYGPTSSAGTFGFIFMLLCLIMSVGICIKGIYDYHEYGDLDDEEW